MYHIPIAAIRLAQRRLDEEGYGPVTVDGALRHERPPIVDQVVETGGR